MTKANIIIAGGGIGGLSLALTLHQLGVPCVVLESAKELRPLGVGINIQPNAVRELFDLGISEASLAEIGVSAKEWALLGQNGQEIYSEQRGTLAGYKWPQFAIHRGEFQMLLARVFQERAGKDALKLGQKVIGYENNSDEGVTVLIQHADGSITREHASMLIGADGIHSKVRAQMHPEQPPIHWGGAIMWRGTTLAKPIRTGSSFIGLGTHRHRMVIYPISSPDPNTGLALINWIAEVTQDDPAERADIGWFRPVEIDDFVHHFEDWTYDWLNVPDLIRGAQIAYENPMIDRDPIPTWQSGSVALMGDAAHAMYPTGSNGASQAIIDARVIGSSMLKHGVTSAALKAYNDQLCDPVSELILRNRGAGPFGLLNMVNERCGGRFTEIDEVISPAERSEFMSVYKSAAGFAMDALNAAAQTIPTGSKIS